jgi:hypothetical protein
MTNPKIIIQQARGPPRRQPPKAPKALPRPPRSNALNPNRQVVSVPKGKNSVVVSVPAAKSRVTRTSGRPSTRVNSRGEHVVVYREYLGDLDSTATFQLGSYSVNPGNPNLFPWLATQARGFECYTFDHLAFELVTDQPSTVGGTTFMAFDPDYNDTAPTSKTQLYTYENSTTSPIWQSAKMALTKDQLKVKPWLFTTNGSSVPSNGDPVNYHAGVFYLGAMTTVAIASVAEIWVSYVVRFKVPQQVFAPGTYGQSSISTGVSAAIPLGTSGYGSVMANDNTNGNLANFIKVNGTSLRCVKAFKGELAVTVHGTVLASPNAKVTVANGSIVALAGFQDSTATYSMVRFAVNLAENAVITFATSFGTTMANCILNWIGAEPSAFTNPFASPENDFLNRVYFPMTRRMMEKQLRGWNKNQELPAFDLPAFEDVYRAHQAALVPEPRHDEHRLTPAEMSTLLALRRKLTDSPSISGE